jgi:hypothetical protein
LQDDATGYDTNDIVEKLRCEAQKEIRAHLSSEGLVSDHHDVNQLAYSLKRFTEWQNNHKSIFPKVDKVLDGDDGAGNDLENQQKVLFAAGVKLDGELLAA